MNWLLVGHETTGHETTGRVTSTVQCMMAAKFTLDDVALHNKENDLFIIIDGNVYDVSKFAKLHPGGKNVLVQVAGQDASEQFWQFHNKAILNKYKEKLLVGTIAGKSSTTSSTLPSSAGQSNITSHGTNINIHEPFGSKTPFSEPSWQQGSNSPYYTEAHRKFKVALREWIEQNLEGKVFEQDEAKMLDKTLWKRFADAGFLAAASGPQWPTEFAGTNIGGGIKPEEFDAFHELILFDELARPGSGGVLWGMVEGLNIGLPPVLSWLRNQPLRKRVATDVLTGNKVICLAITEPSAGSDVAGLRTTANLSADGKHYIVNGEKKWITNGIYADWFTTAVRTGGAGQSGISLLLIERGPGVTTRRMDCMGMWASGTTFVTFENVEVPVENIIGDVNQGFKPIMNNFNHERWAISIQAAAFSRVLIEESINYALKRKTFGKRLIDHPVIRLKLAHMIGQVEAVWSWLETLTFQMKVLPKSQALEVLGGPVALAKLRTTQTFDYVAREASQIFGGLAYTRGGQGEKVERLYREVRAYTVPAGSEEIMAELGVKQALKRVNVKL